MSEIENVLIRPNSFSRPAVKVLIGVVAFGLIALAIFLPRLTWPALLMAGMYALGLALGSTFFIALQQVCKAKWSRSFDVVPRMVSRLLPWTLLVVVPALTLGLPTLYEWSHPAHGDGHGGGHGAMYGFKAAWLSTGFFWARSAVYLAAWLIFARLLAAGCCGGHCASAQAGSRRGKLSAAFIVVFAITFVASSFDWIMSIDYHWFSTIFGVYNFAGVFLSTLAFITLWVIVLRRAGLLEGVKQDQLHDLGRLIFAFSSFWAYIWFCQYMLIWYSNLPEETGYYALRHAGGWQIVSFFNVVCNWVVPFIALIARPAKRDESTLMVVCTVLLIGRALDLAFMILPPFAAGSPVLPLTFALLATAAGVALFVRLLSRGVKTAA